MKKRKIIIVENEDAQRDYLTKLISKKIEGYTPDPIGNFDGAMHMAKTQRYYAALVDLDLGSPKGDGTDIIVEIAKKNPFCYFIIRSANAYKKEYNLYNKIIDLNSTRKRILGILDSFEIPTDNIEIDCIRSYRKAERRTHKKGVNNDENYLGKDIIDMLNANIKNPNNLNYKDISYIPGSKEAIVGNRSVDLTPSQRLVLELFLRNIGVPLTFKDIYNAYGDSFGRYKEDDKVTNPNYDERVRKFLTAFTNKISMEEYLTNITNGDGKHIGYKFGEIEY